MGEFHLGGGPDQGEEVWVQSWGEFFQPFTGDGRAYTLGGLLGRGQRGAIAGRGQALKDPAASDWLARSKVYCLDC